MNIQTTSGVLRTCTIKGVDVKAITRKVAVNESVCTPYLTAELTLLDATNIINGLNIAGGEEVVISFFAPINNKIYDAKLKIMSLEGQSQPDSLRSILYRINLIGEVFFKDRTQLVQKGVTGITGTDLIRQIATQYLGSTINIPVPSTGPIATNNPFTVNNLKPITAIEEIRKRLLFGNTKTGNSLFFRDRDKLNLAPLEYLFSSMTAQERFIQKTTWGANWRDVFESERAIIEAVTMTRQNTNNAAGRGNVQDVAAAANQGKAVFDMFTGRMFVNQLKAKKISVPNLKNITAISSVVDNLIGSIAGAGNMGGAPNIQITDSNRHPNAVDPTTKTEQERLYSATAKAGPQYRIKVPLQRGINVTVGNGIFAELLPPIGDTNNMVRNPAGGLMLVTDLTHEVYTDNRLVKGTTTFKCIKPGLNA